MPTSTVSTKNTPFTEAISHFQRKIRIPIQSYADLSGEVHAKGFMIAGAMNDAMLADFQSALLKAQQAGTTLNQFRDDFDRFVSAYGWQHSGNAGWRSAVIFNTNMRTSLMAGKWERAQRVKESMPYLRYTQVQRPTKRENHAQWHGKIVPIDDPWWNTHYPPNGWGCRCSAMSVSEALIQQEGWQVWDKPESFDGDVPEEWAYNVGKAGRVATGPEKADWQPIIDTRDHATYARPESVALDSPRAKLGPPAQSQTQVRSAVQKMLGGSGNTFTGPDGLSVGITAKTLGGHLKPDRAPIVPLIPEMLENPFEIWLMPMRDLLTGRVELRRRYLKGFNLGKGLFTWFIAEYRKGELEDVTMVRSDKARDLQKQRKGLLLWGRK